MWARQASPERRVWIERSAVAMLQSNRSGFTDITLTSGAHIRVHGRIEEVREALRNKRYSRYLANRDDSNLRAAYEEELRAGVLARVRGEETTR